MSSWGAHSAALALLAVACSNHRGRDAGAALVRAELTGVTGCYDDSNGPCVIVTIQFSNHAGNPITVDGYRVAWFDVPIEPGLHTVEKSVPDVHIHLAPGAAESRSVRIPYLGVDMNPLTKEAARIEILGWH